MRIKILLGACLSIYFSALAQMEHPKLTIVMVIDQLSTHYYPKLKKHLTGGIKELYEKGIYYSNAWYPHSQPGTAAGHTLISTGTVGNYHGIISNWWYENGKRILSDGDDKQSVFAPQGIYPYGKSARNCKVDGLSDNIVLYSNPQSETNVWSISHKSRAAIAMASRFGKALWFDSQTGHFTTSKAYFPSLPQWLSDFNKQQGIDKLEQFPWKLRYPSSSDAYNFKFHNNYAYSPMNPIADGITPLCKTKKHPYEAYCKTPPANKLLLELGKEVLKQHYKGENEERFVLWISMSGLDKVGHKFGSFSTEAIDMLYHMDEDIKSFMEYVYTKADPKDVLLVLTGDHGSHPIVDLLADAKLDLARRVDPFKLQALINVRIKRKYGIPKIAVGFNEQQYYLDQAALKKVPKKTRFAIYKDIKKIIEAQPGVRQAWTFDELYTDHFDKFNLDIAWKHQLFKGRSGDIIFSIYPYTNADKHLQGTGHQTPYAYDAQVPLIFYRKGHLEKKVVAKNVSMTQLAPTLAQLMHVPRPSACNSSVLPGINYK